MVEQLQKDDEVEGGGGSDEEFDEVLAYLAK